MLGTVRVSLTAIILNRPLFAHVSHTLAKQAKLLTGTDKVIKQPLTSVNTVWGFFLILLLVQLSEAGIECE